VGPATTPLVYIPLKQLLTRSKKATSGEPNNDDDEKQQTTINYRYIINTTTTTALQLWRPRGKRRRDKEQAIMNGSGVGAF
jgi:hypothetical protein